MCFFFVHFSLGLCKRGSFRVEELCAIAAFWWSCHLFDKELYHRGGPAREERGKKKSFSTFPLFSALFFVSLDCIAAATERKETPHTQKKNRRLRYFLFSPQKQDKPKKEKTDRFVSWELCSVVGPVQHITARV